MKHENRRVQCYDSPSEIDQCLNCDKPKCNNCLCVPKTTRRGRPKKPIVCFLGDYERYFPSVREAAAEMHICEAGIRNSALYGFKSGGYFWRYV